MSVNHDSNISNEITNSFDASYYLEQINSLGIETKYPWEHYQKVGWKLGYNPSIDFNIDQYWNANPDVFRAKKEPLQHWIEFGKSENRKFKVSPWENNEIQELLGQSFDSTFYVNYNKPTLGSYQDIMGHFCRIGWRLMYDPNPSFDTKFYKTFENLELDFEYPYYLHFLLNRKNREQLVTYPRNQRAWDFSNIGILSPRPQPKPKYRREQNSLTRTLGLDHLIGSLIEVDYVFTNESLISWGNNNFLAVSGGIEVVLQHELNECIANSINHIYIYRDIWNLEFGLEDINMYGLIINGSVNLKVTIDDLDVLIKFLSEKSHECTFNLHGKVHSESSAVARIASYAIKKRYFVHDYSFVCSSYTLLRNDIEYCAAPPPSSNLCKTCIAGSGRSQYLSEHRELLVENQFTVISPSGVAAEIFSQTFSPIKIKTRPHLNFSQLTKPQKYIPRENKKYRVAFTGHSARHKGWDLFEEFTRHVASRNDFDCFHLGNGPQVKNVEFIKVDAIKGGSDMLNALVENEIDVVFQWSLQPETYGLVTAEALAAGCLVITHPGSGNPRQMAKEYNRILSYENFDQLLESHDSGALEAEVTRRKNVEKLVTINFEWNSFINLDSRK